MKLALSASSILNFSQLVQEAHSLKETDKEGSKECDECHDGVSAAHGKTFWRRYVLGEISRIGRRGAGKGTG